MLATTGASSGGSAGAIPAVGAGEAADAPGDAAQCAAGDCVAAEFVALGDCFPAPNVCALAELLAADESPAGTEDSVIGSGSGGRAPGSAASACFGVCTCFSSAEICASCVAS